MDHPSHQHPLRRFPNKLKPTIKPFVDDPPPPIASSPVISERESAHRNPSEQQVLTLLREIIVSKDIEIQLLRKQIQKLQNNTQHELPAQGRDIPAIRCMLSQPELQNNSCPGQDIGEFSPATRVHGSQLNMTERNMLKGLKKPSFNSTNINTAQMNKITCWQVEQEFRKDTTEGVALQYPKPSLNRLVHRHKRVYSLGENMPSLTTNYGPK